MHATDLPIENESLAQRGLTNSERVTCLLIASEHALKLKQDFPTTEQLRSIVAKLETRLSEKAKPERPTHLDERIDSICRGADRQKIIAATIACLLVGDSVRVKMPGHPVINIGITKDPRIVLERHPSPLAGLWTEWQTHPKPHRITAISVARALACGESLESAINDLDADTGLNTEQLETLKRILTNYPAINALTLASRIGAAAQVVSRALAQHRPKRMVRVATHKRKERERQSRPTPASVLLREQRRQQIQQICGEQPHISTTDLAKMVGASYSTTVIARKELGLRKAVTPKPPREKKIPRTVILKEERKRQCLQICMANPHISTTDLAKMIGAPFSTTAITRKELGLRKAVTPKPPREKKIPLTVILRAQRRQQIQQLVVEQPDISQRQIAKTLKCGVRSVGKLMRQLGIDPVRKSKPAAIGSAAGLLFGMDPTGKHQSKIDSIDTQGNH